MLAPLDAAQIRAILLDIEGTTTPVDFVYNTLFPFSVACAEQFLAQHYQDVEVAADVEALRQQRAAEAQGIANPPPWRGDSRAARIASAAAYFRWLVEHDRKLTALKSLQGKIWEAGYRSGELHGAVYPDVPPAFARWRQQGRSISIFSSGSVLAQKLLFRHSTSGDLTPFIASYFDTATGPKQNAQSYSRIADSLRAQAQAIVFISDTVRELDAAREAGLQTLLCVRPEARPPEHAEHPVVHTFDEVLP